jgi:magnesium-transporting ATPase (P-type)
MISRIQENYPLWRLAITGLFIVVLAEFATVAYEYATTRIFDVLFLNTAIIFGLLALCTVSNYVFRNHPNSRIFSFLGSDRVWLAATSLTVLCLLAEFASLYHDHASTGKWNHSRLQSAVITAPFLIWMLWLHRHQKKLQTRQ